MTDYVSTMSARNQVAIPEDVQELLGLKPGDQVAFIIEDGVVRIARPTFTVESADRSTPPVCD